MTSINCKNEWNDYTGGSEHQTIEEARQCEREYLEHGGIRTHVVIIPLDEYERLTAVDTPVTDGFDQVAIDFPTEDVIVGILKQLRTRIDEDVIRLRWRGMSADTPLDVRVMSLIGNNGPEYAIIMSTLAGMA